MVVSDRRMAGTDRLARIAVAIAEAGVPLVVQLREKDLDAAALLDAARQLVVASRSPQAAGRIRVMVNGRFDVALAAEADGVHLPANGPPVERVREAVGDRLRVGRSTHAPAEVRSAVVAGADYALFGPVFRTPSKAGMGEPQGVERLRSAVELAGRMPLLAVGGIDGGSVAACRAAGARGVAVIRAVLEAPDPVAAARVLAGRR